MNKQQSLISSNHTSDRVNRPFPRPIDLASDVEPDLVKEVRTGLIKTPKQLSSGFRYDAEGSRIFQEIVRSPEYYLTRSEYGILTTHKAELVQLFTANTSGVDLIDLGAGNGLKTRILLEELWGNQGISSYIPVDVSEDTGAPDNLRGVLNNSAPFGSTQSTCPASSRWSQRLPA